MKKTVVFSILILCFVLTSCSSPKESPLPTDVPAAASTPLPTHTPIPDQVPAVPYHDVNWDNYVECYMSSGHFSLKNSTVEAHFIYFYPKNRSEDITFCLFEKKEDHPEFSSSNYKLSEALYIFPAVRENNQSVGRFDMSYAFNYWDVSGDGLDDFYFIGIYKKDGIEYYDTRIYLAYETEDGIFYKPDYERMAELNTKYSRVDGQYYPVGEELNDEFDFSPDNLSNAE